MSGKLKEIRGRIISVNSTQQITIAMKMVSAAKLRRAQDRIITFKIYSNKLKEVLQSVVSSLSKEQIQAMDLTKIKATKNALIIVITSDRGLCGAFNTNIIKKAKKMIETDYQSLNKSDITILPIGKKGYDFFRKEGFSIIDDYKELMSNFSIDDTNNAIQKVINDFKKDSFQSVSLVYAQFKNASVQRFVSEQFLPFKSNNDSEVAKTKHDYIFEPQKEKLLQDLIPQTLQTQLIRGIFDTTASEHGARMVAMEKASENAKELVKELKLSYNKARQDAITTELSEIVAGAASL